MIFYQTTNGSLKKSKEKKYLQTNDNKNTMPQTYGMQQKQFFLKLFILCLVLVVGYGICVASGESFC